MRGILDARHVQTAPGGLQQEIAVAAADFQQPRAGGEAVAFQQIEVLVGGALLEFIDVPVAERRRFRRENNVRRKCARVRRRRAGGW